MLNQSTNFKVAHSNVVYDMWLSARQSASRSWRGRGGNDELARREEIKAAIIEAIRT
ncbi:MAG: hypothetical protein FWH25_00595 [Syntrophorhabdaceae bacterium]|nr:hypothetical protein [Syntrophorhabdaceae bacterium]